MSKWGCQVKCLLIEFEKVEKVIEFTIWIEIGDG